MNTGDFNRNRLPHLGWQFFQPQTSWHNPMAMVSFNASVEAIINHRKANKAITAKHKLPTDHNSVADELEQFTRARLGLPPSGQPSFFQPRSSQLSSTVAAVAADIKRAAAGTGVILDWLGAGGEPVEQALAEKRAETCVECPKNVPASWYVEAPANVIKSAIATWQKVKGRDSQFVTTQGDNLQSCDVCKCLMQLKVFCPLEHILAKTPPDILKLFPQNCWIYRRDK